MRITLPLPNPPTRLGPDCAVLYIFRAILERQRLDANIAAWSGILPAGEEKNPLDHVGEGSAFSLHGRRSLVP